MAHTSSRVLARNSLVLFITAVLLLGCAVPTGVGPGAVKAAPTVQPLLRVHFVDVGQGDAELIQTPDGCSILIDGANNDGMAQGYLQSLGVKKLDLVVFTHPDSDHIGGLPKIISSYPIGEIASNGQTATTNTYNDLLDAALASGAKWTEVKRGDTLSACGLKFDVLHPIAKPAEDDNRNNASVVLRLVYGDTSFLFEGDAEAEAESDMLAADLVKPTDVLKVAHHGSDSSSTPAFLSALQPRYAAYSAGVGNDYGHPNASTLDNLKAVGAKIYGTDVSGTIIVDSDGQKIGVLAKEVNANKGPGQAGYFPPLMVTHVTSPVIAGDQASLSATTIAGADCTIEVEYKNGPSTASGLEPTVAGPDGVCAWTWGVGSSTSPGTWPITVGASMQSWTNQTQTSFVVEEAK